MKVRTSFVSNSSSSSFVCTIRNKSNKKITLDECAIQKLSERFCGFSPEIDTIDNLERLFRTLEPNGELRLLLVQENDSFHAYTLDEYSSEQVIFEDDTLVCTSTSYYD
ncbi:MAG: hypothetical protein ACTSYV_01465 [Candidatus Heimdallarchaeaceae archaeon]